MTKTTQIFLESESPTLKLDIAQYLVKQKKLPVVKDLLMHTFSKTHLWEILEKYYTLGNISEGAHF